MDVLGFIIMVHCVAVIGHIIIVIFFVLFLNMIAIIILHKCFRRLLGGTIGPILILIVMGVLCQIFTLLSLVVLLTSA